MQHANVKHFPFAVIFMLCLTSCSPKPMSPHEEAKLKTEYLNRFGSDMTAQQKNIFRASRFKTEIDANKLLTGFREINKRSRKFNEVKDNSLGELAA
ncbi:MAG: hypothetical protein ACYS8W_14340, partial [Planctomycetota bacterium]